MTAFDLGLGELVVESAILLALPLRAAATLLTPGLRRKLVVFPRLAAAAAVAGAGVAIVVALAAFSVHAWRALSAFTLLVLAVEAWTARPGYGRARGLPPGSLALAPLGPWIDPEFYATSVRRHGPVFKMRHLTTPQVCVADLALARDLLRRYHETLYAPPLPFDRFVPGGFIRYLPPAPHAERRALLRAAISPGVVDAGEPVVRKLFEDGLRTLARDAGRRHPRAVLDPVVFQGSAYLFFGLAPGSPAFARFEALMRTIDFRRALWTPARRVRQALDEAQALLRIEPPAGFLGTLGESDPAAARDPGLLVNLLYVFNSGAASDIAALMSWVTWWVATHPDWLRNLRESDAPGRWPSASSAKRSGSRKRSTSCAAPRRRSSWTASRCPPAGSFGSASARSIVATTPFRTLPGSAGSIPRPSRRLPGTHRSARRVSVASASA